MNGFFSIARAHPERAAVVDPVERVVTYGELAGAANRIARGLAAEGITAGSTVAAVMPNCVEALGLYAACVQSGLTIVLVNWHLTAAEIAYILEDCGARLLVAHERFADVTLDAAAHSAIPPHLRYCVGAHDGFRPLTELGAGQPDEPLRAEHAGQIMFYTSGTTGRPKGVRKRIAPVPPEEIGLLTGIGLRQLPPFDPDSDGVHLIGGPLYHGLGIAAAARPLDAGELAVLMDRWTPERWLELVERYRVTHVSMVPTMFHRLLALPDEVRLAADVSSLRSVSHAGAACAIDLKRRMIEWLGPIITESYSSTEGAGTSVTSEEWLARPGTVGRPSPGVVLKILDNDGNECPPGVPGRVFVSQALWEFEYLNDPAKTDANRRDGLFTVGDIGYVDEDGYLFLCDRDADIIVSGGVNIYPAEVEARLVTHPAVADVAVIGVPNEEWGEEVRAVVEPAAGVVAAPELEQELVVWCRDALAHYKCPRRVDFVESLQRDPNGKIRKAQIRAAYWEGHARRI